jgi:uncharacterized protein
MTSASSVAKVVNLNGGCLVGKTRLQKTVYFLESLHQGFGFEFSYHHYGPYSEELTEVTHDAKALGMLNINYHISQQGTEYAVFSAANLPPQDQDDDTEVGDDIIRRKILMVLSKFDSVELELAATADFLSKNGHASDPWGETRRRKSSKVTDERISRAQTLLASVECVEA